MNCHGTIGLCIGPAPAIDVGQALVGNGWCWFVGSITDRTDIFRRVTDMSKNVFKVMDRRWKKRLFFCTSERAFFFFLRGMRSSCSNKLKNALKSKNAGTFFSQSQLLVHLHT